MSDFIGPSLHRPSKDPFEPSFWIITGSMGFPEGTKAGGYGTPFEEAELVLIKHAYHKVKGAFNRKAVGASLVAWGGAMLVPGPVDAAAFAAGAALFKHPLGGIAGVAAYNAFAMATVSTGAWLISS